MLDYRHFYYFRVVTKAGSFAKTGDKPFARFLTASAEHRDADVAVSLQHAFKVAFEEGVSYVTPSDATMMALLWLWPDLLPSGFGGSGAVDQCCGSAIGVQPSPPDRNRPVKSS